MEERYQPEEIEARWQKRWDEKKVFSADNQEGEPFYILEMFPYPSGNLHMGHISNYSIGDVLARYKRLRGAKVLHPMGWDALGLPAEQAAIQDGIHPRIRTKNNIESVKKQMTRMGFSYDWDREIATCTPEYYKWNQWFFLQMLEKGLVYRRESWVNWSPGLQTVLANEQVVDGKCWRTGVPVEQKMIPEWAFRITDYAQELLDKLDELQEWPDRITSAQRNWIGRSTGAEVAFKVDGEDTEIKIYTTRVDTIFGCSYMVLAPEHKMALPLTEDARKAEVEEFITRMKRTSKMERTAEGGVKEGVFTGSYAINPYTGEKVPIWLANFVLAEYGTGAVMSVPAHDQRDFEFAKQYGLEIRSVIRPEDGEEFNDTEITEAFTEYGVLYNSGDFSGMSSKEARHALAEHAKKEGFGEATVNFRLRDWGFSRQRYWGTPIPVMYGKDGELIPVTEDQLPVEIPQEAILEGEGMTPLGRDPEFVNTTHPETGEPVRRETETMDTFVDSAWYYARFLDPKNTEAPFSSEKANSWLPVDVYIGGPEHAVMHLLYFRFWHKVMRDLGLVNTDEPVKKLITQGMVVDWSYQHPETYEYFSPKEVVWDESITDQPHVGPSDKKGVAVSPKDGVPLNVQIEKMGKSKKNGVSPDEMSKLYGADTLRLFVLFASPPEKDVEWSETGVKGCYRFITRVWRFFHENIETLRSAEPFLGLANGTLPEDAADKINALKGPARDLVREIHVAIQSVTDDIEKRTHLNTAIAAMMKLVNAFYSAKMDAAPEMPSIFRDGCEALLLMLAPFAPHIVEELWSELGHKGMIAESGTWPVHHEEALKQDSITIVVQINGKVRGKIQISPDASKDEVLATAKAHETVQKHIEGKDIKREIVVPGRLVNLVVK